MQDDASPTAESYEGLAAPSSVETRAFGGVGRRHPPITERCKDQLAEQYLLGMPISEMAHLHGFDPKRVSQLFRSDEMKERVSLKRAHLLEGNNKVMFKFLLHADTLAQAQVDCALTAGPDQYKARTWILERIAPARSTSQSQVDVNVNVNHEVMVGLRDALTETAKVLELRPTIGGIALLDGKSAMPPSNYEMEDEGPPYE